MVGFQEVDGFLPFGEPELGLGHIECAVVVSSLFPRVQRSNGHYFWPMMRFGNHSAQDATGGALQVGSYRQIRSLIILLRLDHCY